MKKTYKEYEGREQCRAVLRVWSGKSTVREMSREMGITEGLLRQWQERAMEGMLAVLAPREKQEPDQEPVLPPKLRRLLERKAEAQAGKFGGIVREVICFKTQKTISKWIPNPKAQRQSSKPVAKRERPEHKGRKRDKKQLLKEPIKEQGIITQGAK